MWGLEERRALARAPMTIPIHTFQSIQHFQDPSVSLRKCGRFRPRTTRSTTAPWRHRSQPSFSAADPDTLAKRRGALREFAGSFPSRARQERNRHHEPALQRPASGLRRKIHPDGSAIVGRQGRCTQLSGDVLCVSPNSCYQSSCRFRFHCPKEWPSLSDP
jgi:hypothetical protein